MKSITSTFLLLTLIGCSPAVLVTIVNETDIPRVDETVSVLLPRRLKGRNLSIKNSRGEQIPCQSIIEKNGEESILFQVTIDADGCEEYSVKHGKIEEYPFKAYSRHVPERMDDYAFENNVIAGRIYGPALKDPRTLGQDIWLKCTERLIIDDWFQKGDYHHNYGEGMDCYKVGNSLGGGACAPVVDSHIVVGDNWTTQERLMNGPIRTAAIFTHPEFEAGNAIIKTARTFELDANTRMVHRTSTFQSTADSVEAVLGAVLHDVVSLSHGSNFIAFTEKASDSRHPEQDGNISIGLVLDPGYDAKFKILDNHACLAFSVKSGDTIHYWTASGWSQGGVESHESWASYMESQATILSNPLRIKVK